MSFYPKILKDPQLKLPKKERAAILKQAANLWFSKRSNIVLYVCTTLLWVLLMFIITPVTSMFGVNKFVSSIMTWIILYPLMFLFTYWMIFNFNFLPHLYQELRTRQHDVCPKCGYILINLPLISTDTETNGTANCPECGTPRTPLPKQSDSSVPAS